MLIVILFLLGLFLGSFVNALVYRLHEQSIVSQKSVKSKAYKAKNQVDLSITKGRSMCPHCHHQLAAKDLVPVISWLSLGGKCRYCKKPIGGQYPLVELATALLFVASYLFWPLGLDTAGIINFVIWLAFLVGFMALLVYDLRWMLLPNRLMYPLLCVALGLGLYNVAEGITTPLNLILSVAIAGGIFWLVFTVSNGRWIGGGDVKLGALIGLILGDPYLAFLMLMSASIFGTLFILPGLALKKVTPSSRIPFGPFLIIATILTMLFGPDIIAWYKEALLL